MDFRRNSCSTRTFFCWNFKWLNEDMMSRWDPNINWTENPCNILFYTDMIVSLSMVCREKGESDVEKENLYNETVTKITLVSTVFRLNQNKLLNMFCGSGKFASPVSISTRNLDRHCVDISHRRLNLIFVILHK